LAEAVRLAETETKKRHADWKDEKIREVSQKIAMSAIKFSMLRTGNNNVIVFDIDEALRFDGFTGPYLQYTISRINSILRKEPASEKNDLSKLNTAIDKLLVIKMAEFPEIISGCVKSLDPSPMAGYLFDLAKMFSHFYETTPILNSDEEIKKARLYMISCVKQVLVNGLTLLGIEELEQM